MRISKTHDEEAKWPSNALLRERQVLQLIPVSRATFRRWLRDGRFPSGFRLCGRIAVWRAADVYAWIDQRDPADGRGGMR
ncbi:helix-turn-helix transcriptional regulator [Piscinibacter terrae]|uniref:AlpA family phage regulatory protein n=1 Tax=Piscinibacter terrae TaxID=2496871 RepID=A0A3N7HQB1_9BURK|nr:AlpA family phage regulatory protein [Albitalea terrae]